jgi:ribosomal-protein-alanine N-acetyltransferase
MSATPTAVLRDMTAGDMPAVMALEQELFPEDAWTPEMFAREFAESGPSGSGAARRYIIAEPARGDAPPRPPREGTADTDGQPASLIGYAGMLFSGGPEADVLTLAVHPGHWGNGVGTTLLKALIDEAARRGCTQVFLEVREDNPRARDLYQRHGFAEIGIRRGYYQPAGVDAIVMRKDL